MTKLRINITKEVLEASKMCIAMGDSFGKQNGIGANCAIALGVRDLFPKAWITTSMIYPFYFEKEEGKDTWSEIDLPWEARKFIHDFDALQDSPEERVKMKLISFEVEVSDEIIDELNIPEIGELLKQSKTLELV